MQHLQSIRPFLALGYLAVLALSGCDSAPAAEQQPVAKAAEVRPQHPLEGLAATPTSDAAFEAYPELRPAIAEFVAASAAIPSERKKALEKLALFIKTKRAAGEAARLTFICTHNSRRSHLAQIWSTTAAAYYGLNGISTYSGGTESTAFNPRAVQALTRAGFHVDQPEGDNPRYHVTFGPHAPVIEAFSKKYSDPVNPHDNFAAVMTCTQADKNCPTVEGAALRVALPYEDPKVSDGTPAEAATYDERSKQIATEMFYLLSRVAA